MQTIYKLSCSQVNIDAILYTWKYKLYMNNIWKSRCEKQSQILCKWLYSTARKCRAAAVHEESLLF
jgi:hypothetical protein